MTKLTSSETAKAIAETIEKILGVDGLNLLGQYKISAGANDGAMVVPAVQVAYPRLKKDVTREFVSDSGIEAVVMPQPNINTEVIYGGNDNISYKNYMIYLDQRSETGLLTEAVEALMCSGTLNIVQSPEIRQERATKEGIIPPRAVLFVRQIHRLLAY